MKLKHVAEKATTEEACCINGGAEGGLALSSPHHSVAVGHLALSQTRCVYPAWTIRPAWRFPNRRPPMIVSAIAAKLKQHAKGNIKGRHGPVAKIFAAENYALSVGAPWFSVGY